MRWILELWRKVAVGSVYGIFAAYLRAWFIEGGFYMPPLFQIPSYKPGYILTIWEKLSQLFFCKQRQLQRCGCSHKLRWPSVTNSVTARVCGWQNHKVRTCSPSLERCPWALPGARSGGGGSRGSSAMGNGPGTAQRSAAPLCSRHGETERAWALPSSAGQRWDPWFTAERSCQPSQPAQDCGTNVASSALARSSALQLTPRKGCPEMAFVWKSWLWDTRAGADGPWAAWARKTTGVCMAADPPRTSRVWDAMWKAEGQQERVQEYPSAFLGSENIFLLLGMRYK